MAKLKHGAETTISILSSLNVLAEGDEGCCASFVVLILGCVIGSLQPPGGELRGLLLSQRPICTIWLSAYSSIESLGCFGRSTFILREVALLLFSGIPN